MYKQGRSIRKSLRDGYCVLPVLDSHSRFEAEGLTSVIWKKAE